MKNPNVEQILNAIADKINITSDEIIGERRTVNDGVVLGRFLLYSILRDVYKWPLTKVAQASNRRRHNTVIYGLRTIKADANQYQRFIQVRDEILNEVNGK